jgi:hypothetical protein
MFPLSPVVILTITIASSTTRNHPFSEWYRYRIGYHLEPSEVENDRDIDDTRTATTPQETMEYPESAFVDAIQVARRECDYHGSLDTLPRAVECKILLAREMRDDDDLSQFHEWCAIDIYFQHRLHWDIAITSHCIAGLSCLIIKNPADNVADIIAIFALETIVIFLSLEVMVLKFYERNYHRCIRYQTTIPLRYSFE